MMMMTMKMMSIRRNNKYFPFHFFRFVFVYTISMCCLSNAWKWCDTCTVALYAFSTIESVPFRTAQVDMYSTCIEHFVIATLFLLMQTRRNAQIWISKFLFTFFSFFLLLALAFFSSFSFCSVFFVSLFRVAFSHFVVCLKWFFLFYGTIRSEDKFKYFTITTRKNVNTMKCYIYLKPDSAKQSVEKSYNSIVVAYLLSVHTIFTFLLFSSVYIGTHFVAHIFIYWHFFSISHSIHWLNAHPTQVQCARENSAQSQRWRSLFDSFDNEIECQWILWSKSK